jgi:hypothetical protein
MMTGHPEFTVLLARQRTGTNALRSVLETHADICCFNEVFKLEDRHSDKPFLKTANYFTFLEQYCAGDVTKAFPDRAAEAFTAYLAYLRGLTTKKLIVIDVKYNSTHIVTDAWREIAEPTLFPLLKARQVGVLHLMRRNLLRCLVSSLKAWRSDHYHIEDGQPVADRRLSFSAPWALARMESWAAEDEGIAIAFNGYPFYKQVDYVDLFPELTGVTGAVDSGALLDLATWFGVPDAFTNHATFLKLSSLPLDETIEGFEDFRATFRGTRFEHFLEDEPAYRKQPSMANR